MKFTIKKKTFIDELNIVTRSIDSFSPMPALSGIKMESDGNKLVLTGSDGVVSICSTIQDVEIHESGCVVLESKYLLDVVKKSSGDEIEIDVKGTQADIYAHRSKIKLNGMEPDEYPDIDFDVSEFDFHIELERLKDAYDFASYASTNDAKTTRPVLKGINFHAVDGMLYMNGSDSIRLSRIQTEIGIGDFSVTIPKKVLDVIKLIKEKAKVGVCIDKSTVIFKIKNMVIKSGFIGGNYPDVSRIIPGSFTSSLKVNRTCILEAIDRASLIKIDGINAIRFKLSKDACILETHQNEIGNTYESMESFEYEGDGDEFVLNGQFLSDAIKHFNSESVIIRISGKNSSGNYKPFLIASEKETDRIAVLTGLRDLR